MELNTGEFVTFVYTDGDTPHVAYARVESDSPLSVLLPAGGWCDGLEPGERVSLVHKDGIVGSHADATIGKVTRYGLSLVVQLENAVWESFDRRRSDRHEVSLQSEITLVSDSPDSQAGFDRRQCVVTNLSSVGCRVSAGEVLPLSTLLAVNIDCGMSQPLRVLGVVTRHFEDPSGFAVEFFDYVGPTRFMLDDYLGSISEAA
jgi:hypothetical protein